MHVLPMPIIYNFSPLPLSLGRLFGCFVCVLVSVSVDLLLKFEAKAFQGPWDEEPIWKVYKVSS